MEKEKSERSEEINRYPPAFKLLLEFARERGLLDENKKEVTGELKKLRSSGSPEIREIELLEDRVSELEGKLEELNELMTEDGKIVLTRSEWRRKQQLRTKKSLQRTLK